MSKLITKGNIALFEYPPPNFSIPKFNLEDNGVLWIDGYNVPLFPMGKHIRAMKRFETNLIGYVVVGRYKEAKDKIQGDFSEVLKRANIDTKNLLVMIKKPKQNAK